MSILLELFRKFANILGFWSYLVMSIILLIGTVVVPVVFYISRDLPDYKQLMVYDPPGITRIYSRDGVLIASLANEHRIFTDIEHIPGLVKQAFIAAEDQNFYEHQGVDITSIIRALFMNLKNMGGERKAVGGSTITQQVVKNFLVGNEHSITRKIKEAILAYRISQAYTKERILELYLNQIYLGNSAYGVTMAALAYFNKELSELSVEEAALLAAMPKAPSALDPYKNYQRAKIRRDWVIERMLDEKFISDKEAINALAHDINLAPKSNINEGSYYTEAVRLELLQRYGAERIYNESFSIFTNMDTRLQKIADTVLVNALERYDRKHGYRGPYATIADLNKWQEELNKLNVPNNKWQLAMVMQVHDKKALVGFKDGSQGELLLNGVQWARKSLPSAQVGAAISSVKQVLKIGDVVLLSQQASGLMLEQVPEVNGALVVLQPKTGKILAMTGGYSFRDSKYNRVLQAMRQPGSVFKPIVYLTALENGYTPNSMINDAPVSIDMGPGQNMWQPKNYKDQYAGPITLRTALAKSKNVATVRLIAEIGVPKVARTAMRLGIYSKMPPIHYSMALGAVEVTPLDITKAYNVLASDGIKVPAFLIDRVEDKSGELLYKPDYMQCDFCMQNDDRTLVDAEVLPKIFYESTQVISPEKNYQLISMLQSVVQEGTGTRALQLQRPVAAKTGTSNDSLDVWTIGFTKDLVCGVYIGYDTPKTLGKNEQGASLALPVFVDFMQQAHQHTPIRDFVKPESLHLVKIDKATGEITNSSNKLAILEALTLEEYENLLDKQRDNNVVEEEIGDLEE